MSAAPARARGPEPLALLLLGLLALAVRLPGLGRSLWYDELVTLSSFAGSPLTAWTRQVAANNHPLASLLAWAAGALPEGEAWQRLPFALLGGLAAPALAWSAGGRRAGLLGGALLALSPGAVLLSQQVRGYAGLLLASALLPGLLVRALGNDAPAGRSGRLIAALALTAGLGLTSHLSLALPLALWTALAAVSARAGLATLAGQGTALLGLLGGWLLGLLGWAPILGRTARWMIRTLEEGDPGAGGLALGPHDLAGLLGGSGALGALLAVLLLGAAVAGSLALLHPAPGRPPRPAARRLGCVLLVPLLCAGALLLAGVPAYPRFLTLALPGLLLLAGAGWGELFAGPRAAVCVAPLLLLAAPPLGAQARSELQDLRGAARAARALAGERGPVVGAGFAGALLRAYDPGVLAEPGPGERGQDGLAALLQSEEPLGWIDPFPAQTPPERRALLARALGPPLVFPGSVTPVLVYWRAPR